MNKNFSKKIIKNFNFGKYFSTSEVKNQLYLWMSNVSPGKRPDDYLNRMTLSNIPRKLDFFDDKNPKSIYMGPRHSGVITEDGNLYTFGSGNWGILGHGNEQKVPFHQPKLVEFFSKNNIKLRKVCMGDFHTVALTEDGQIYTWGYGGKTGFMNLLFSESGALGHGDKVDVFVPKKVKFFEKNNLKIKNIACGKRHSVALTGIN